jgi:hypothetical protein
MFMESGRALCLSLLVYCDINVLKSLGEIDKRDYRKSNMKAYKEKLSVDYSKINKAAVLKELLASKKLLYSGQLEKDIEEGSDSAPSEDNMEEEDIKKIMPDGTQPAETVMVPTPPPTTLEP